MKRNLENLALLKEVIKISKQSRHTFKNKIIIKHTAFIEKKYLKYSLRCQLTCLDNYIQLTQFSDLINCGVQKLQKDINFMKKTNMKLFEYMELQNTTFIKIDDDFKYLLNEYQSCIVSYDDVDLDVYRTFGTMKIGFWN